MSNFKKHKLPNLFAALGVLFFCLGFVGLYLFGAFGFIICFILFIVCIFLMDKYNHD